MQQNDMQFDLQTTVPVLERTLLPLRTLLSGLAPEWIDATEGADTWSPFIVVGHLVHGARTDWITRVMAKPHRDAVGRWRAYLSIMDR